LPAFTGVAVKNMVAVSMRAGTDQAERVWAEVASGELFDVLQVPPQIGRVLTLDDEASRTPVVVISDTLWRTRFDADPGVIGRAVILNNQPFSIVGVTPPGFQGAMG